MLLIGCFRAFYDFCMVSRLLLDYCKSVLNYCYGIAWLLGGYFVVLCDLGSLNGVAILL